MLLPNGHPIGYVAFCALYSFAAMLGIASHAPGEVLDSRSPGDIELGGRRGRPTARHQIRLPHPADRDSRIECGRRHRAKVRGIDAAARSVSEDQQACWFDDGKREFGFSRSDRGRNDYQRALSAFPWHVTHRAASGLASRRAADATAVGDEFAPASDRIVQAKARAHAGTGQDREDPRKDGLETKSRSLDLQRAIAELEGGLADAAGRYEAAGEAIEQTASELTNYAETRRSDSSKDLQDPIVVDRPCACRRAAPPRQGIKSSITPARNVGARARR